MVNFAPFLEQRCASSMKVYIATWFKLVSLMGSYLQNKSGRDFFCFSRLMLCGQDISSMGLVSFVPFTSALFEKGILC